MPADLGYAILRAEKLKNKTMIRTRVQHAVREGNVPNADKERAHLNQIIGPKTYDQFREKLDGLLKGVRKFRSDSPEVIELFIGASPEFFTKGGDHNTFFKNSYDWAKETFGEENILLAAMHRDETSPHWSMFICPRIKNPELAEYESEQAGKPLPVPEGQKGRRRKTPFTERPPELALSAISYMKGKQSLSSMQTKFWEAAGKPVGLKRGKDGSKAVHMDMEEWKAGMVASAAQEPQTIEMRKMTMRDRANPDAYLAEFKELAEGQMRAAALAIADAKERQKKMDVETERLQNWEKRIQNWEDSVMKQLMDFKGEVDVVAQKQTAAMADLVRDQINSIPVLKNQVVELQAHSKVIAAERSLFMRALAKTIKNDYSGEKMVQLEVALGVAPGKDDIFARLVKSGRVENFESAVALVASYIEQRDDESGSGGIISKPETTNPLRLN